MEQNEKKPLNVGLLAHVDAGKTTLSEALLYTAGALRSLGRVDHRDAYLDTHDLERARGITIFSKQARLSGVTHAVTLVDTPGHVDFSAEAERTLPVLDCAVLVISASDGVQAHTETLWRLLRRYRVPTFLFVNKMDLPETDRERLMADLQQKLDPGCLDFCRPPAQIAEAAALCDETLLEFYLESGCLTLPQMQKLIREGKVFPCCFGSALRLEGVEKLLRVLETCAPEGSSPSEFSARVYKISRDDSGTRLTWLKVTGGRLKVRSQMTYENRKGEQCREKVTQLRLYSGDRYTAAEEVSAGTLLAVTGLSQTYIGQPLGAETRPLPPVLEPVMTYRVQLPAGSDPAKVLPQLRLLEEEDPQLHLLYEAGQIHIQIMGRVQLEIFRSLVQQRFGLDVTLEDRRIFYMETISVPVEGVGHFEPLRHYAECHLLLEPLPRGSGLRFDTVCPTDVLDLNFQRLILTHLEEKTHRGVLIGAPITDMKITLLVGKAHLKHTEGGDFREATYRAVRQGLMQAKSVLLEPWYDFELTLPTGDIGRAITDIRNFGGEFDPPEAAGAESVLRGRVPAAEIADYPDQLAAYTQGRGRLRLTLHGYESCHNTPAVLEERNYDPELDSENTPDSVFCAHGAGFSVKWNRVQEYMHLDSGLSRSGAPEILPRRAIDDLELEQIMEREFGPQKTMLYRPVARPATEEVTIRPPREKYTIVDGYNIIYAWDTLAQQAKTDLDAARRRLCDILSSYAGFTQQNLVLVFDGYRRQGSPGEKTRFHNIQLVYTAEGETADAYIEALASRIGSNYQVRVATSDGLVQLSSFRSGVLRMSARELQEEVEAAGKAMEKHFSV